MKIRSKTMKAIIAIVKDTPGVSLSDLRELLPIDKQKSLSQSLYHMIEQGYIRREGKPGSGSYGAGYRYYPAEHKRDTPSQQASGTDSQAKEPKTLSDYSPRELLTELKRRGYVWDKMWVETKQYVPYNNIE